MTTPKTAFEDFRDQLGRYVSRRVGNPEDAEDILQEVFVRVVRNEQALKRAREPLAWLYSVTRSVLIDHYRKQGRAPRQARDGRVVEDPHMPIPPESEFDRCLAPLIDCLPDKYREAVRFVDMKSERQTEYSRQADLSLPAAKSRVQRGRKMLRRAILQCCRVELDSCKSVIALEPADGCQNNCC